MKALKYFLVLSFCVWGIMLQAQNYSSTSKKAIKSYQAALNSYRLRNFKSSMEMLDKALKKDDAFIECYLLKAEIYQANNMLQEVVDSYEKVLAINPDFFPYIQYNLGEAYWRLGNYKLSKQSFASFLELGKGKEQIIEKAREYLYKCDFAIELVNNPVEFNPIMLDSNVNRFYDQYFPSFSIDGKTLVFTALLPDSTFITQRGRVRYQEDFYYSTDSAGTWSYARPLPGNINSYYNEGAQQISADGKTLVFTGCNRQGGYGRCDLYFSYLQDGSWSPPVNAGPIINTKYSEKQPTLSSDGKTLYFSSNRPGGFGGMDLYYTRKGKNGQWTAPKNLDSLVNTELDDVCPFIHPDNKSLYFSSDGHPGLGLKDIFLTRLGKQGFSVPENLGYPINTNGDEISLVVTASGRKAYYAGDNKMQRRAIYQFDIPVASQPNPVSYVQGRVLDIETRKPLSASLFLFEQENADTIIQVESEAESGQYLVCLPSGENYAFHVKAEGYLFHSEKFELKNVHSLEEAKKVDIFLNPIKVGTKTILRNIFFALDDYHLNEKSNAELKQLLEFLNNNPELDIEISGHTDNQGDEAYNQKLSEQRAGEVHKYLLESGVMADRISFKGYGETQPIADNETEQGRAQNRRTEIKITGI